MTLPAAIPEVPAADVAKAIIYYENALGFAIDWIDEHEDVAGVSRAKCRLFLTSTAMRAGGAPASPIRFWLNLESSAEVDELFEEWKAAGARIVSEPEDKPWNLHEFTAADLDGNLIRVFYDFTHDRTQPA